MSALSTSAPTPTVEHGCAINVLQLNLWSSVKRKLPFFFPLTDHNIGFAQLLWFQAHPFGLCHGREKQMGKGSFGDLSQHFVFWYLGSEDSHAHVVCCLELRLIPSPLTLFAEARIKYYWTALTPPTPAPATAALLLSMLRRDWKERPGHWHKISYQL